MSAALPEAFTGPGLVDLQLNGYGGFDFNSPPETWTADDLHRVRAGLARRGIVAALPTLITAPAKRLLDAARRYRELVEQEPALARTFPALHVEGPFISPEDGPRGAHPRRYCITPVERTELLHEIAAASGGRLRIVTLAPELPGALPLIERLAGSGVVVAIGHTGATARCIAEAVDAGAGLSTHLGNGSHQLLPRLDNYVQAQLAEDGLMASFIADGHHIPWFTLKNFLRAKGSGRSILVSDSVAAAGAPPGRYSVGEVLVESTPAGRVQVPGQPNLAGSALTLDRAVANVVVHCGVPLDEAWRMASSNPARIIGLSEPAMVTVDLRGVGSSS